LNLKRAGFEPLLTNGTGALGQFACPEFSGHGRLKKTAANDDVKLFFEEVYRALKRDRTAALEPASCLHP
jgi:hypothetical protein